MIDDHKNGPKITAEGAARLAGVTMRTIWRWRDSGRLQEAGRIGRNVMFWKRQVLHIVGVKGAPNMPSMAEVYMRMKEARSMDDVEAIKDMVAAGICSTAQDKKPLQDSWRAMCEMAATSDDPQDREFCEDMAHKFGLWLSKLDEETEEAIRKAENNPKVTRESAERWHDRVPNLYDPAATIARKQMMDDDGPNACFY